MTEAGLYTGGTVPYGYHLRFVVHSPSAYSNSVRSVKVSGRLYIASITINLDRKAGQPVRLSLHLVPKLQ